MAKITKGNVFEDLGFDPAESADLALRIYLMAEIRKFIERNELTQVRAAKFFGIRQPKISNIMNGRINEISSDYLVGCWQRRVVNFDTRLSNRQDVRSRHG